MVEIKCYQCHVNVTLGCAVLRHTIHDAAAAADDDDAVVTVFLTEEVVVLFCPIALLTAMCNPRGTVCLTFCVS